MKNKYKQEWIKIWDFYFSIWFLDRVIEIHLKFSNQLGYENKNTLHIFSNHSEEAYFLKQEIKNLKALRRKKLSSDSYMKKHEEGARDSINKLKEFISNISFKDIPNEFFRYSELLEKLLSYYRASRPEIFEIVEELLKKTPRNTRLKKLIKIYGHLRFDIKKAWLDAENKTKKLKSKFAREFGLNIKQLEFLTNKEIKDLIDNKITKKDVIKLMHERNKLSVFGLIGGKRVLITGRRAKEIEKIIKKPILISDIIKGRTAYRGKIKGKIRVIPQINQKDMVKKAKRFKKGEILVTGMTQPDIITACQKASAIITDEGGITSHAAIISRELKIPCIIGTKIATKVLKDGDVVEIDADGGKIRILKRNNE